MSTKIVPKPKIDPFNNKTPAELVAEAMGHAPMPSKEEVQKRRDAFRRKQGHGRSRPR